MTDDFPPPKKLRFADVNMAQIRFPVEEHPEGTPLVKPDIVASYPGDEGQFRVEDPMAMVSLSFVVRAEWGPDPLLSPLPEGARARMRLLRLELRGANLRFDDFSCLKRSRCPRAHTIRHRLRNPPCSVAAAPCHAH